VIVAPKSAIKSQNTIQPRAIGNAKAERIVSLWTKSATHLRHGHAVPAAQSSTLPAVIV
jgi:hypothetical protein